MPSKKQAALSFVIVAGLLLACVQEKDPCGQVTEIPPSECAALIALYEKTDGPRWKDRRGWLVDPDPCTWFGVTCSAGHVAIISINFDELRGTLPPELGQLEQLKTLSLYFNHLSGTIPAELSELAYLENLILHNNKLSGSIPPELGNLSNLQKLDLDSNELTGAIPPELGDLSELRALLLRDNQLGAASPPSWGACLSSRACS